jgi:hypothetical protein
MMEADEYDDFSYHSLKETKKIGLVNPAVIYEVKPAAEAAISVFLAASAIVFIDRLVPPARDESIALHDEPGTCARFLTFDPFVADAL